MSPNSRASYLIARAYWRIAKTAKNPRNTVKVAILNEGKVFLVKPAYNIGLWTLPGGGAKRREVFEEAAVRELREEVAMEIKNLEFHGSFAQPANNLVLVYTAEPKSMSFAVDGLEVSEAGWFDADELPQPQSPRLIRALTLAGFIEK